MKLLLLVIFVLTPCIFARPGGHGWAQGGQPAPPPPPPQVIHVIRETVPAPSAGHSSGPPKVYHVKLIRSPAPQLQSSGWAPQPQSSGWAPQPQPQQPQVIHVKLQRAESSGGHGYAPPPPPPQVVKVQLVQQAPQPAPQSGGNGWW